MRLPRVRFTLRWMMVATAVAGLALGLNLMRERSSRYRELADRHAIAGMINQGKSDVDYHASMRSKYERAARHPWLPVAPDPPEPE